MSPIYKPLLPLFYSPETLSVVTLQRLSRHSHLRSYRRHPHVQSRDRPVHRRSQPKVTGNLPFQFVFKTAVHSIDHNSLTVWNLVISRPPSWSWRRDESGAGRSAGDSPRRAVTRIFCAAAFRACIPRATATRRRPSPPLIPVSRRPFTAAGDRRRWLGRWLGNSAESTRWVNADPVNRLG